MDDHGQPQIALHHRKRLAVVYVRQRHAPETPGDSARLERQHAQQSYGRAWGWHSGAIMIVDEDLRRAGGSIVDRPGYQRLLHMIEVGHVGLVLVSELSRLSRSAMALEQFLALCQRADVLVAVDGVLLDRRDPVASLQDHLLHLAGDFSRKVTTILNDIETVEGDFDEGE
jgi:DNA invertase Pin-like site-specific DNA recombinase